MVISGPVEISAWAGGRLSIDFPSFDLVNFDDDYYLELIGQEKVIKMMKVFPQFLFGVRMQFPN